ncbi:chorismate mutase [Aerococcus urinaehominis]|uniref:Chorismate mutase n=1 Tax=Aerococcus urinaehominis TaxID=128944 RepID=A0A0X8FMA7_9LACT|nr:chorismate mutase [Aerococcus urinaehominis]AMB99914.1 chorismate mutase [Aerococcus urinaehominis]SDM43611.1 chorismate mutase [Aerococcus urinaehominis]
MLTEQRNKIDAIDREIVRLFEERTAVVEEVAEIKLANGKEVLDASREAAVIDKVQGYLKDPSLAGELADLYENIMRISRGHQEKWMAERGE